MLECGQNTLADIELAVVRSSNAKVAGFSAIDAAERSARDRMFRFYKQDCPPGCNHKRAVEWKYRIALLEEYWDERQEIYVCKVYGAFKVVVECSKAEQPKIIDIYEPVDGGDETGGSGTGTDTGNAGEVVKPNRLAPCVITNTISDDTPAMAVPGIASVDINVTVTATASNPPGHTFAVRGVTVNHILYMPGHPLFGWKAYVAAHKVGIDVAWDLTKPIYGLKITYGVGTVNISGTLNPGVGGIACQSGHEIYFDGTSTDSNGDSKNWDHTYILK